MTIKSWHVQAFNRRRMNSHLVSHNVLQQLCDRACYVFSITTTTKMAYTEICQAKMASRGTLFTKRHPHPYSRIDSLKRIIWVNLLYFKIISMRINCARAKYWKIGTNQSKAKQTTLRRVYTHLATSVVLVDDVCKFDSLSFVVE